MAPLHSLGRDKHNEVQHYFFGHVMQLEPALASYDADTIINGTTTCLRSTQLK